MKRIERFEQQFSQTTFARWIIGNVVRTHVDSHPFLRNFEAAVRGEDKKGPRITERLILDIFDPKSHVSYVLLAGLPGSGKTTFADALATVLSEISLGTVQVDRESFSQYRAQAQRMMRLRGEAWTKERETELATEYMKKSALRVMRAGPQSDGKRRVVVAEIPVYPVDGRERGLGLIKTIGEEEKNVKDNERRARILFLKPDFRVIFNGIITRIMKKSAGGSADMLYEIALKAYGGAMMFKQVQPELYKKLMGLIKDQDRGFFLRRYNHAEQAAKIIAVRMLLMLQVAELHSSLDTVVMNPVRRRLRALSRHYPQQQPAE